ncbi:MAG: hypothetical protein LBK82_03195 [Planctomycetaceae bacterium]|jgi:hypothetical protein|nr:hypothetical protein [Planctomycetaceae bacterium]
MLPFQGDVLLGLTRRIAAGWLVLPFQGEWDRLTLKSFPTSYYKDSQYLSMELCQKYWLLFGIWQNKENK